ncbi:hypothetical protein C0Z18_10760 [Trinickia dabaoshanensis]|uniref:HrpE/YscL family type III secretion apparatus protein n=1 Tax=Trinickia dabaoshanensis TaxID=564714 RepID=A0A2N7VTC6_9BURK|nr:HrpE/YscL family type III secretion apparatus protein [Trinickia dabaoshanensis]PMS20411.1 hypothetical protein C0Z18_10760 [Trinickia dabaoshanensis]
MSFTARRMMTGAGHTVMSRTAPLESPRSLILRAKDVARLHDIESCTARARREARSIVKQARRMEQVRGARLAAMRRARERDADRSFVARAMALDEAYRLAQRALTSELEATLDHVLAGALAGIGVEIPAAQRLRVVSKQLSKVAGSVPAAYLRLCSLDASTHRAAGIHCPWPIRVDEALQPGQCELVTEHGHWALSFDALMEALSAAALTNVRGETAARVLAAG